MRYCYVHGVEHECPPPAEIAPTLFDAPLVELEPFARGMAGSELAATKWNEDERAGIDAAILATARELESFTADDVWQRAGGIRVTKGLAGRLNAALHAGLISSTGRVAFAGRGGVHDHGQRLAVWSSRIYFEWPSS